jgi:hypothetical protein
MAYRDRDEKEYYDRVYEAWRTGRDSDAISRDDWDYYKAMGYQPDEISTDMLCPRVRPSREEYPIPVCDICGQHDALTGTNGYGVCSEECHNIALNRAVRNTSL